MIFFSLMCSFTTSTVGSVAMVDGWYREIVTYHEGCVTVEPWQDQCCDPSVGSPIQNTTCHGCHSMASQAFSAPMRCSVQLGLEQAAVGC